MNKMSHKIKNAFLAPRHAFKRIWAIATNKKVLDIVLDLEDDLEAYLLKVKREENKDEILKGIGMKKTITILKEKLHEARN